MTDNDITTICGKIESLHDKIIKSKFSEMVTESEMICLILAVQELNRQKAEIERLKDYPKCVYEYDGDITDYCLKTPCPNYKTVDAIRTEAVKEFAERLKEYVESYDVTTGYKIIIVNAVEEETIDNLVKEMERENNG